MIILNIIQHLCLEKFKKGDFVATKGSECQHGTVLTYSLGQNLLSPILLFFKIRRKIHECFRFEKISIELVSF